MARDYDVLVVGSGFGGSVAALRLTEKGYRVGVIEAGRRFEDHEFAKTSWRLNKYLWAPKLGLFGVQRVHLLKDVMILAGAGVGGGSLNYANTLYKPPSPFFRDAQWGHITDWEKELTPYYEQARKMLGVVTNPSITPADRVMREVAEDMGVGDTFVPTPVGVFFGAKTGGEGEPGETVPDPYFGGAGPDRTACTECGECMTGCRHNAKNTLLKNYLHLAEKGGAHIIPRTTVRELHPRADGSWDVVVERTGAWVNKRRRTFTADHVIVAAGAWGSQNLLHRQKQDGHLPNISDRLGHMTRTNSEAIVGAMRPTIDPNADYSEGVAITSSFFPEPHTHIEPVRYGKGSNAIALLQTLMTDGGPGGPRWWKLIKGLAEDPKVLLQLVNLRKWSQRTVISLVMQNSNNSLTTHLRNWGPLRLLSSRQGEGEPNPSWIPAGNEATRRVADKIGGVAGGTWGEIFDIPLTAHFIGGAPISDSPERGVVDPYNRVWGHPTLHITDGTAMPANPGVNPSLSITAIAERATALWPNKGEADPRPSQDEAYRDIAPVAPVAPVVPADAPAALNLGMPVRR
ncbi:FAD-dependent oxidoreductase [Corynebacterium hansenii]|uniref:Cholesterol oxidase n=1 Tax=Corynebacterium hansenii TaxID=394964 RepID=A0ABV7ZMU4_9CORY|nr:GMC family oxidoreductase [Corynebacterium hansenii]WJY99082.1 Cholesterol oxidase [Corynebacterium hansenii]